MDTRFFCDLCLTSRIEAHFNEMRRLSAARDKAKVSVSNLLFDTADPDPDGVPVASAAATLAVPSSIRSDHILPDPFDTKAVESLSSHSADQQLLLHSLIQLRAQRAAILSRVQSIHQCISESQHTHLQGKEALKEKTAHIALRKQNLAKAWSGLEGSSAPAAASAAQRSRIAAKSRWLAHPAADHIDVPLVYTDVYTHYERQSDDPPTPSQPTQDSTDRQLGATLTRVRLQLASLQADATAVSAELAAKRAALARQAFDLFTVSPPDIISSRSSTSLRARPIDLSASTSVAQRITRLSERYIPGAFGLGLGHAQSPAAAADSRALSRDPSSTASRQSKRGDSTSASPSSSSNWSIVFLPLPLPSEARRYPRETVNGAVTYAVNLLQLLAGYLGVALPFSIEQHKGRLAIRPDPLWDGGGGSSAKTLYLSSSAYAHLTASNPPAARPSKLNHLAESTIGLGASTLSTIESYIHLPSGAGLPWGMASTAAQSVKSGAAHTATDTDTEKHHRSEAEASSSKSKSDQAAKSFVSALVMLSYNVAYLATKQGIQLDLVAAAANPLHLLSKIMQQPDLGRLAHTNHIRSSEIEDLSLPSLDYEQLAQILEPSNATADGYKRGAPKPSKADSSSAPASRPTSGRSGKPPKILEQSYVDVGEAAASVLNLKDPSSIAHNASSQPSSNRSASQRTAQDQRTGPTRQTTRPDVPSSLHKQGVGADKRGTPAAPAQPPPSLDFLRQRGRDASKAKGASAGGNLPASAEQKATATPPKVGPGAVIFNGVEVGVGNLDSADSGRPSSHSRALDTKSRKQSTEEGWDLV